MRQKRVKEVRNKKKLGLSIRVQLIVGFVVPILFIVAVGIVSYTKASEGLTSNYEKSSMTALEMTVATLEEGMKNIVTNTSELSQDPTVMSYSLGGFDSDSSKQSQAQKTLRNSLSVKETSSEMIQALHIIPVSTDKVVTTKRMEAADIPSFMDGLETSEDAWMLADGFVHWGSSHPYVDEQMGISENDYIMFCSRSFKSGPNHALVIADVSRSSVMALLQQLDFGEDAQVSFITAEGLEVKSEEDVPIADKDFFTAGKDSGEGSISEYIRYEGKDYYFMMCKSSTTGGYIAVMVPESYITESSSQIQQITIFMVAAACLVALLLSSIIITSISRNIAKSVAKLGRVSDGELLEQPYGVKMPNNEFGKLHGAISYTIRRMRELVLTIQRMIGLVSESGQRVSDSSKNVGRMVQSMSTQIEEIRNIIEKEDNEITACNGQMEELSVHIKTVSTSVMDTIGEIDNSKNVISQGINAVTDMTKQSKDTSEVTMEVQERVMELTAKLNDISTFVDSIKEIAEQTNLLSLNASIEAARAGEHGKGFSVVAEEIRNLADGSAKTATSIKDVIEEIRTYSNQVIDKVHHAGEIVESQEQSVNNTAEVFNSIGNFVEKLAQSMQQVTVDVEEMNEKRHLALKSIRVINELSENTVQSADEVNGSLEMQIQSADTLETEAKRLEKNMKELEASVAHFKLTATRKASIKSKEKKSKIRLGRKDKS